MTACAVCGFTPHDELPARSRRGMHTVIDSIGAYTVCDCCAIQAVAAASSAESRSLTLVFTDAISSPVRWR